MGILASFKQPATFMNSDVIKTGISVDWMKKLTYRDETVKIMKGLLYRVEPIRAFLLFLCLLSLLILAVNTANHLPPSHPFH